MSGPFNAAQRVVLDTYGGGDYAHLTTLNQCRKVGDTLFTFLMVELDAKEDCDTIVEALRRVCDSRDQLDMIRIAVEMKAIEMGEVK